MDYFKCYNTLIERARCRTTEGYTELHHITPRCMGGDDSEENLVKLYPEEHYLAHQLLVKMHPNHYGLVSAALYMCTRPNNKLYGWLKRKRAEEMKTHNPNKGGKARREYNKKYGAPNRGYKHTEQTKQLISERLKANNPNKDGKYKLTITRLVHSETNEVLVYNSLKEAEKAHDANHASVYNNRKAGKPYRGYYWYVGEEIKQCKI